MLYGVACYLLWGLFPLYWPLLEPAGSIEILAHRIVWSLLVVATVLASAGIATAVPLLFFASAARRIPLSTLGLLQYIAPVLQFLTGVLLYDEPMPASRWVGFLLVWAALAVLTFDGLRQGRRTRRDARAQLQMITVP